jgi:metallo-beta-lactamase family protein
VSLPAKSSPAFAVERSQALLYIRHQVFEKKLAPRISVSLNSPMASNVTKPYQGYPDGHRLSFHECARMCEVADYISIVEDSPTLKKKKGPRIIISGRGMLTAGRILHYFKAFASGHDNAWSSSSYGII